MSLALLGGCNFIPLGATATSSTAPPPSLQGAESVIEGIDGAAICTASTATVETRMS